MAQGFLNLVQVRDSLQRLVSQTPIRDQCLLKATTSMDPAGGMTHIGGFGRELSVGLIAVRDKGTGIPAQQLRACKT